MPKLDLGELEQLWSGKRIRDIVRREGNVESGLDAALDVIDILISLAQEQQAQLTAKDAKMVRQQKAIEAARELIPRIGWGYESSYRARWDASLDKLEEEVLDA